jgi:DNA-binding SARP family transcriptional activator
LRLESGRVESWLGYLLPHRDAPQSRQRMAFLLRPDPSDAQARTNLRHVLHTLLRTLPNAERYLGVTAGTLQWRPTSDLQLDVADFAAATGYGNPPPHRTTESTGLLSRPRRASTALG